MAERNVAFLLAPGAGAPTSHPRMQNFRTMLESVGAVVPFDYSYTLEGRKSPDRLPKLIETHRAALAALREKYAGPIVLARACADALAVTSRWPSRSRRYLPWLSLVRRRRLVEAAQ